MMVSACCVHNVIDSEIECVDDSSVAPIRVFHQLLTNNSQ